MKKTLKEKVYTILYICIAKYLPKSRHSRFSKWLRGILGKRILKSYGKNINIERGSTFSSQVSIGDNSSIGINAELVGEVSIGSDVMMGPECSIYSFNHSSERVDISMIQQGYTISKKVTIKDDVWIGKRVIILPGVTIGEGAIIGAGTVVTKDVPPFSVFCGNPGKVKKYRK